jgi:hypothetical protein
MSPPPRPAPTLALLLAALLAQAATAQDDGFDVAEDAPDSTMVEGGMVVHMNNEFVMNDPQFDSWIFQDGGNAGGANPRAKLENQLALRIEEVGRSAGLDEPGRRLLLLAGTGDIERFFDRVDAMRRKHRGKTYPQNEIGRIYQELQPLAQQYQSPFFGARSLFGRTLRSALPPEQFARYDALATARRRAQYEARIGVTIESFAQSLGLTADQRNGLEALLRDEAKLPVQLGQNDHYMTLYQVASLPEDRLRALFDEPQWKILQPQLQQARGMKDWLRQNGFVPAGEPDPAEGEPATTAAGAHAHDDEEGQP